MSALRLTLASVKATLRLVGVTLTHRGRECRVNYLTGTEATAYYTDDLADALWTGIAMAEQRDTAENRKIAREKYLSGPDNVIVTARNATKLRKRHDSLRDQAQQLIQSFDRGEYQTDECQQRLVLQAGEAMEAATVLWGRLQAYYD